MARKHPTFKEQQEIRWCWRNNSETGILDRLEDLVKQEEKRELKQRSILLKDLLNYCNQTIKTKSHNVNSITSINLLRSMYEKDRQYSCIGLLDDIEKYLHIAI